VAEPAGQPARPDEPTRIVLYVRPGCHLCEVAAAALDEITRQTAERWIARDVQTNPAWEADYGDRVPVVMLDGREHGYWRIDADRLVRDLRR
jgi:glutaredoxin